MNETIDPQSSTDNITGSTDSSKPRTPENKKGKEADYEALVMSSMPEEVRNRKPLVTIGLIGMSVLMAIITLCKTGSIDPSPQDLVALGANVDSLSFGGQLWRLFTASFLHAGIEHLAFNMLCLFSIGMFLEKLIGRTKLFSAYFLTAFTGGVLSCVFHENTACVGASGAVFGLFGATVAYIGMVYRKFGIEVAHVTGYMKNGLVFLGINFVYSLMPNVDMAGHIGGFLGGLALGGVLGAPIKWNTLKNHEWYHRGVLIATAILAAIMMISWFAAKDAGRLGTKELASEVGTLLRSRMIEGIEQAGGKNVDVKIKDLTLFHDGGNDYHGLVEMTCKCNGETENLTRVIKVTYDGEKFMYQMADR